MDRKKVINDTIIQKAVKYPNILALIMKYLSIQLQIPTKVAIFVSLLKVTVGPTAKRRK